MSEEVQQTDTTLLDWQESVGCQVWRAPDGRWTASVRHAKKYIQPTKPTLREALQSAMYEYKSI